MIVPFSSIHNKINVNQAKYQIQVVCLTYVIAVRKVYLVYACGFDRNGKWEWFCKSKWRCKNDIAEMTSERALATLLADGITSTNNPLFVIALISDNIKV